MVVSERFELYIIPFTKFLKVIQIPLKFPTNRLLFNLDIILSLL